MNRHDVVVVGSGIAGLSVAMEVAGSGLSVALLTSGDLVSGSTAWAQGGVAAAIGDDDDPAQHARDTIDAGAGHCNADVVRSLASAAPHRLNDLISVGTRFDRDRGGRLALTQEGGHRRRRIAHAGGDATGAEISRALVAALHRSAVDVLTGTTVLDVTTTPGRRGRQVTGVVTAAGVVAARAVVLATGGIGGLYASTTNPPEVSGAGLAIALRAGASLVDLEFVQFHPTALRVAAGAGQVPLVSEAVRGEGGVLRDESGQLIMAGVHPMGDLAPRDIVARRIDEVMSGGRMVGLDATGLGRAVFENRFPTVSAGCRRHGIDPSRELIPVIPAQHFLCGGIRTDPWGQSDVPGLYAVGEVAATGVHGANRLASNSLIEGAVFGRRVAQRLMSALPPRTRPRGEVTMARPAIGDGATSAIQALMARYAGVRRHADGLARAADTLDRMTNDAFPSHDAADRWTVATAIVAAATARQESRGCHWREDYPRTGSGWRQHVVVKLDESGMSVAAPIGCLEQTA